MVLIHIVPVVTYFIISGVCLICFVPTPTCFHRRLRLFIYLFIYYTHFKQRNDSVFVTSVTFRFVTICNICLSGYRIIPSAWKGITPEDSPGGHCPSLYSTVFFNCLQTILRTGRSETAWRGLQWRYAHLIEPDKEDKGEYGNSA